MSPPITDAMAAPEAAPDKKPWWYLRPDSIVRVKAYQICAKRLEGKTDEEIAVELDISRSSVTDYLWRAAKNGWFGASTAKEEVQFNLLPKALDNLREAMDSDHRLRSGMKEKYDISMRVAEMTVAKDFESASQGPVQQTIVAVKIEMPEGPRQEMREDTIGGTPAFQDAEVDNDAV